MAYATTTVERMNKRQEYDRLRATLWTERSSFDATWREVASYLFPVRPRFMLTDRNRGDRRTQNIIDSTATYAANTLRSGLHAGLTSPARPWMKLSVPDPSLAKYRPVKLWLNDLTERMHVVFQLSNLYNALPLVYGDMAIFGTAAMGVLDDPGTAGTPGDLFRCYPYPIGSYALGMDNRGLVTTFVRDSIKTVGQLVEEFGGANGQPLHRGDKPEWANFSRTVKDLWDRGEYESPIEVCWVVRPNRDRDADSLGADAFPWVSCHFEKGRTDHTGVLREGGFYEFPVLAPRWFTNAEDTYGTDCPGLVALGDIKQLQVAQKRKGQAIEKQVNPPMVGPANLKTQQVSMIPGGMTYADVREGMTGLRPVHEVKPDLTHFVADIQETQYRINRAFFVDIIQMLGFSDPQRGAQPVTAREVDERHEEKLMALGPVLESTIDELLDPLVDRVFAMMERNGLIPDAPPELDGVTLKVEYVSIMAQAQKLIGVVGQDRLLQATLAMVEAFPSVRHKLNAFKTIDKYADSLGVDPDLINSDEDATASLQAEQNAMQQQADAESALKVAQSTKALGTTPMQDDTALTRVLQGATG